MKQPKFNTYTFKGTYGIDDLWSSWSNTHDWPYFNSHFGWTEEDYNKNPEEYERLIKERNDKYIQELKENGKYLTHYDINISFMHNPLFDDAKIPDGKHGVLIPRGKSNDN